MGLSWFSSSMNILPTRFGAKLSDSNSFENPHTQKLDEAGRWTEAFMGYLMSQPLTHQICSNTSDELVLRFERTELPPNEVKADDMHPGTGLTTSLVQASSGRILQSRTDNPNTLIDFTKRQSWMFEILSELAFWDTQMPQKEEQETI